MPTQQINGQITDTAGKSQQGLVVRIAAKGDNGEIPVGLPGLTDKKGLWRISFTDKEAKEITGLVVRVFDRQGALVAKTEIKPDQEPGEINVVIGRDNDPEDVLVVRGKLAAGASFAEGHKIAIYGQGLPSQSSKPILGQGYSDAYGNYYIPYRPKEGGKTDMVVKVEASKSVEAAQSDVYYNVESDVVADITVKPIEPTETTAEYDRYLNVINPVIGNTSIENLSPEDITFISNKTGIQAGLLESLRLAGRWATETKITAPIFYALLRTGFPLDRALWLEKKQVDYKSAVEKAVTDKIISIEQASFNVIDLQQLAVEKSVQPDADSTPTVMNTVLKTVLSPGLHENIIKDYVNHDASTGDFWEQALANTTYGTFIPRIKLGFDVSVFTGQNTVLTQKVLADTGVTKTADLVDKSSEDWKDLMVTGSDGTVFVFPATVTGKDEAEKKENYANQIVETVERKFPAAAVVRELKKPAVFDGAAIWDTIKGESTQDKFDILEFDLSHVKEEKIKAQIAALQNEVRAYPDYADTIKASQYWVDEKVKDLPPNDTRKSEQEFFETSGYNLKQPIAFYLQDPVNSVVKTRLPDDVKAAVEKKYRLHSVGGDAKSADALANMGFNGAVDILRMPEADLKKKFEEAGVPLGKAKEVLDKAAVIEATGAYLAQELYIHFNHSNPRVMGNNRETLTLAQTSVARAADAPVEYATGRENYNVVRVTYENLFGSMSTCACDHCRSVYGPAAYFVDFLHNLLGATKDAVNNPGHILLQRRPDLQYLKLNCENTETRIPYIDLVNEILEIYIAHNSSLDVPDKIVQTDDRTAEEIAREPLILEETAYDFIKEAVYPLTLPFDRDFATKQIYLTECGTSLYEVLVLAGETNADILTGAILGLSKKEYDLLTTTYISDTGISLKLYELFHLNANDGVLGSQLRLVETFMQKTSVTIDELGLLWKTEFLKYGDQNNRKLIWGAKSGGDACNLDDIEIKYDNGEPIIDNHFARINCFIRLWKKLGCTIEELDNMLCTFQVINAEGVNSNDENINEQGLAHIAYAILLKNRLGWSYKKVVELFVGESAVKTSDQNELAKKLKISAQNALAKKLGITSIELLQSREIQLGTPQLLYNSILKLDTIRQAGFKLPELAYLTGDAIEGATKMQPWAEEVLDFAKKLRDGLRKVALDTVVPEAFTADFMLEKLKLVYEEADTLKLFSDLFNGKIITEVPLTLEVGEIFPGNLDPRVRYSNGKMSFEGFVTSTVINDLYTKFARISADDLALKNKISDAIGHLAQKYRNNIQSIQPKFLTSEVVNTIFDELEKLTAEGNEASFKIIFDKMYAYLTDTFIAQLVSNEFKIDAATTRILLDAVHPDWEESLKKSFINKIEPAEAEVMVWLTPPKTETYTFTPLVAFAGHEEGKPLVAGKYYKVDGTQDLKTVQWSAPTIKQEVIAEQYLFSQKTFGDMEQRINQFEKFALLVQKFKLQSHELEYIIEHGSFFGSIKFDFSIPTAFTFQHWQRLADYTFLKKALQDDDGKDLLEIFRLATIPLNTEALKKQVLYLTQWKEVDLETLGILALEGAHKPDGTPVSKGTFLLDTNTTLINEIQLLQWYRFKQFKDKYGFLPEQVTTESAGSIKKAILSKYEGEAKDTLQKRAEDKLRALRRDALVAYLLAHPKMEGENSLWTNTNELYEYFLIDVEMEPMATTSRIVQANATLQLFAQRVLMNLEQEVAPNPNRINQIWYDWMHKYRVWEANRKVFLYPENWLEPELRDDKSEIFKAFESELLQGEVTNESAVKAVGDYLNALDGIARLDVRAFCEDPQTKELHVVARTFNVPHVYYYRRRSVEEIWTPWEKMNVDVEGEQLVMNVFQKKVCIFWMSILEKKKITNYGDIYEYSIKINWATFTNKLWSRKSQSKDSFTVRFDTKAGLNEWYFFGMLLKNIQDSIDIEISMSYNMNDENFDQAYGNEAYDHYMKYLTDKTGPIDETLFINKFPTHFKRDADNPRRYWWSTRFKTQFNGIFLKNQVLSEDDQKRSLLNYLNDISIYDIYKGAITNNIVSNSLLELQKFIKNEVLFENENVVTKYGLPIVTNETDNYYFYSLKGGKEIYLVKYQSGGFLYNVNFEIFYHPKISWITQLFLSKGIKDAFHVNTQNIYESFIEVIEPYGRLIVPIIFNSKYRPNYTYVQPPYPQEKVDFDSKGSYSSYNWELFFHIPLLTANRLSQNQRYQEAQQWYHYIFNPTTTEAPIGTRNDPTGVSRYWQFLPFRNAIKESHESIVGILLKIKDGDPDALQQVTTWRNDPFNPHAIARQRIQAYMRNVVGKYIENLINWGDSLFSQDTMENISEATQLYILAANILGPRPVKIPHSGSPDTEHNYKELLDLKIDAFGLTLENHVNATPGSTDPDALQLRANLFYFCIPDNTFILKYWDTVADRLFKIRHSQNIEGIERQLDLFEPELDPALLVRAKAMGMDIGSILRDMQTPMPHYRFNVMLQKALELCAELKGLGSNLLAAIEKKEAEALSMMRQRQEVQMLDLISEIKRSNILELQENLNSANASLASAEKKFDYYSSRPRISYKEQEALTFTKAAHGYESIAEGFSLAATIAFAVPQFHVQGPSSGTTAGGDQVGKVLQAYGGIYKALANQFTFASNMAKTDADYDRRKEDWDFQRDLATIEKTQIERQILAAEIRIHIAEKELDNHNQQIENTRQIEDFLRTKFSNEELYGWMEREVKTLYNQCYQMVYDYAKRAEKTYRHELGVENTDFIRFGAWDSNRNGLLAGERLYVALKQMEKTYLEQNKRELEITKHVSLQLLHPMALLQLRETGKCDFAIPEELFDLDFPGHYFRRIKSVSITIPCVAGPYTTINATLRLKKGSTRIKATTDGDYPHPQDGDDERFRNNAAGIQSIATSNAQNDSGLFELNFRDERYLPFEGAGAISEWTLELMEQKSLRQFDYNTIADVIMHLRYTARENSALKSKAIQHLQSVAGKLGNLPLDRLFSLRYDFPNEWHAWTKQGKELKIKLEKHHFPYWAQLSDLTVEAIKAYPRTAAGVVLDHPVEASMTQPITADGWEWAPEAAALDKDNQDWFLVLTYRLG